MQCGCGHWLHEECIDSVIQDADGQERFCLFNTVLYAFLGIHNMHFNDERELYHLQGQKIWTFILHRVKAKSVNYMNIYIKICAFKAHSSATYVYTVYDDN